MTEIKRSKYEQKKLYGASTLKDMRSLTFIPPAELWRLIAKENLMNSPYGNESRIYMDPDIQDAEAALLKKDFNRAYHAYEKAVSKDASFDYAWWGMLLAEYKVLNDDALKSYLQV